VQDPAERIAGVFSSAGRAVAGLGATGVILLSFQAQATCA